MATSVHPKDAEGNPIDTPDWRNASDISKEASAVDSALIPQCLLILSPEGRCHAPEQCRSCRLRA